MEKIITEADLRSHPLPAGTSRFEVEDDVFVTESARSWLDRRDIELVIRPAGGASRTRIEDRGRRTYVDAATGLGMGKQKPEDMTHLRGNLLIPKTHPRIAFRGSLDSLQAEILEIQLLADRGGNTKTRDQLEEILEQVRLILKAEVKDEPLEVHNLLGLDQEGLRRVSHDPYGNFGINHIVPSWDMGELALRLNTLRTRVRETELSAIAAFQAPGEKPRPDIIRELNRLSSAVYIILCQLQSEGGPLKKKREDKVINESEVRELVLLVLKQCADAGCFSAKKSSGRAPSAPEENETQNRFLIEASARHVHLTPQAVEKLFGVGARLTKKRNLSQPGEFLSEQRLRLVTSKGEISDVAVLGPERKNVQVELSLSDAHILGIQPPVNLSGDLTGAEEVYLVGEKGILKAPASVIAARAHIHMTPADARRLGVKDGDVVSVHVQSERPITFERVIVRVKDNFSLAMHIDFDEANASCLGKNTFGSIVR